MGLLQPVLLHLIDAIALYQQEILARSIVTISQLAPPFSPYSLVLAFSLCQAVLPIYPKRFCPVATTVDR